MTELPELESVRILRLRPGDRLVATIRTAHVKPAEIKGIRDALREKFPDNEVIVTYGVDLAVASSEESS